MLISDTVAALGSIGVLILYLSGQLKIEYLYGINFLLGLMNAFSRRLITIVTPMLAPFFLAFGGLEVILLID